MFRKEKRKRRDLCIPGGSHTGVFSNGWGRPRATTLVGPSLRRTHWYGNLPYNITRLQNCSSCPPHKSLHTSYNTSDSIKCPVQLLQTMIILFIVSVEGEWLANVQLAKVFTPASCRKCTLTNYLTCRPFHYPKFTQKFYEIQDEWIERSGIFYRVDASCSGSIST